MKAVLRPQRIFVVGLPLSGKSTIGALLAARLKWLFFDLDEAICKDVGHVSVADIFEKGGEAMFRKAERRVLAQFLRNPPPFVLATGGGTACQSQQIDQMNQAGLTLYLKMSWPQMCERLARAPLGLRPLLDALPLPHSTTALEERFSARLSYYEASKMHFQSSNQSPEEDQKALFELLQSKI